MPHSLDWACLLQYTNDNKDIAYKILEIFSSELKDQLPNTRVSLDDADYNAIQEIVHRLKSNLKMFGYTENLTLSEEIESRIRQGDTDVYDLITRWLDNMYVIENDVNSHLKNR